MIVAHEYWRDMLSLHQVRMQTELDVQAGMVCYRAIY